MWALLDFPLEVGHPPPRWRMRRCLASASKGRARLELKGFALAVSLLAMSVFSPFVDSILAKINEEKEHPCLYRKAVFQNTALRVYHTVQPSTHTVLVGTAGRPVLAWGVACLLCAGRPISFFWALGRVLRAAGFRLVRVRSVGRSDRAALADAARAHAHAAKRQTARHRFSRQNFACHDFCSTTWCFHGHVICQGQQIFEVWH